MYKKFNLPFLSENPSNPFYYYFSFHLSTRRGCDARESIHYELGITTQITNTMNKKHSPLLLLSIIAPPTSELYYCTAIFKSTSILFLLFAKTIHIYLLLQCSFFLFFFHSLLWMIANCQMPTVTWKYAKKWNTNITCLLYSLMFLATKKRKENIK